MTGTYAQLASETVTGASQERYHEVSAKVNRSVFVRLLFMLIRNDGSGAGRPSKSKNVIHAAVASDGIQ
jgi:hypothetical protein